MNLSWQQQRRLMELAAATPAPRGTVRDSLWVSLMPMARSLDAALEDRLLVFPRRPAAGRAPQAKTRAAAASRAGSSWRHRTRSVEDLAYGGLWLSSVGVLA